MDGIKYTSDGKKVLVVGKLNAEQTIVQEIFVSAGQEVPSGENFVVKSLHDAPAESWKEKNLRELEQRYEKERAGLQKQIDQQNNRLALVRDKAKLQADTLLAFASNSDGDQLKTLKGFMAGRITHFFVSTYSPEIVSWADGNEAYDVDSYNGRIRLDGIKLVSIFGHSGGDLSYRLHAYRDGSGGSREIFPAESYKEALEMAQAALDKHCADYLTSTHTNSSINLPAWEKIEGINIPVDVREKYQADADRARLARIKQLREELEKLEE